MNDDASFAAAAAAMADGMARICRLYGISGLVGRLYAALFVATEPMALDELCTLVGAAKSSVSVALRKLEAARVARRLPPRNDRRDYYEAITAPWAVLGDWNRLYFTPELEMFRETGAAIAHALDNAADAPSQERARVLRARIAAFRDFSETLRALLDGVSPQGKTHAPARRIPISIERAP